MYLKKLPQKFHVVQTLILHWFFIAVDVVLNNFAVSMNPEIQQQQQDYISDHLVQLNQ